MSLSARNRSEVGRALSFLPPATSTTTATATATNAAALLNRPQIDSGQAVIFRRVFACGLQTVLHDGRTDLLALTGRWPALRVTLDR